MASLFQQNSDRVLRTYARHAPHPHTSSFAVDFFKSGKFPGDTVLTSSSFLFLFLFLCFFFFGDCKLLMLFILGLSHLQRLSWSTWSRLRLLSRWVCIPHRPHLSFVLILFFFVFLSIFFGFFIKTGICTTH